VSDPDSTDLLGLYTREYYLHGVAGHEAFRRGEGGIEAVVNMRRTCALALASPFRRAIDVGAGRGELARHLVERSIAVTLVDYSAAAMEIAREYVGNHGTARYLTISATELAEHVEPASQDAIFLCDVAEHVSRRELRRVLAACARVLSAHGVLCLHSPELTRGAVLTSRAVEARHINLMDIADLRAELGRAFPYAEAFTWNGEQAFCRPGRCIELFGVARHARPYASTALARGPGGAFAFPGDVAAAGPFLLRCDVRPPGAGPVRGRLRLCAGDVPALELPLALEAHEGEPCVVLVASQLLPGAGGVDWAQVDRLELAFDGPAEPADPVLVSEAGRRG
jgi:SAM-dependent methyltransferase